MRNNSEQHFDVETKKDYIIRLAKKDPFLKIEEIAQLVVTTPRYVRTILSEANLSLMNLREEYARKLGKGSDSRLVLSLKNPFNLVRLHNKGTGPAFTFGPPQPLEDEGGKYYWNPEQEQLFKYYQYTYFHGQIFGIIIFVMRKELNAEELQVRDAIFRVADLTVEETRLSNPEIQIGRVKNLLGAKIQQDAEFASDDILLEIKTLVNTKDRVFGEETFYFPGEDVTFTIPGFFSPVLELTPES